MFNVGWNFVIHGAIKEIIETYQVGVVWIAHPKFFHSWDQGLQSPENILIDNFDVTFLSWSAKTFPVYDSHLLDVRRLSWVTSS